MRELTIEAIQADFTTAISVWCTNSSTGSRPNASRAANHGDRDGWVRAAVRVEGVVLGYPTELVLLGLRKALELNRS